MRAPFLVIGAAHWDVVARAAAALGRGADVPGRVERRPGGVALNLAAGLAAAGQPVELVAAVGRDHAGEALAAAIAAAGIGERGLLRQGTTDAYVAIETADGALHAAVADCAGLERAGAGLLAGLDALALPWGGTVVLDGNLPAAVLAGAAGHPGLAAAALVLVPASPEKAARLGPLLGRRPVALYVNRAEAEALAGQALADSATAALALLRLGAASAAVTDGAAAASVADADGVVSAMPPAAAGGVTGAGDRFVARHLAARADGLAAGPALGLALAAAARHIAGAAPAGASDR
ncbi:MAG: PfkB family carbohydrate kinase [Amaricoccus sp.]|uniref:PfkB family carbohydrate kinase n=1 Tax=Amaricoccus sp. TaxID=1872485 RepID=UPI0039E6FF17